MTRHDHRRAVCFDLFGTLLERVLMTRQMRLLFRKRENWDRMMTQPITFEMLEAELGADHPALLDIQKAASSVTMSAQGREIWAMAERLSVPIGVCSNLAEPFVEPALAALPRAPDFKVMSCRTGFRKPDPEIYELVIQAAECKPHEIVFLGDSYKNDVVGPRNAGINGNNVYRANIFLGED